METCLVATASKTDSGSHKALNHRHEVDGEGDAAEWTDAVTVEGFL
ncbi:MAG: hypothetical protein O2856_07985 [Planctomycetota bacterium]|nr:hypothetical protein [Planctomycetota bacterium]